MALTLAEAMKELESQRQERAIWSEIENHLAGFLDHETLGNSDRGVPTEGCVAPHVPQDVLKAFLQRMKESEIDPLEKKIRGLENLKIEETKKDAKAKKQKKPPVKNPRTKAVRVVTQKPAAAGSQGS